MSHNSFPCVCLWARYIIFLCFGFPMLQMRKNTDLAGLLRALNQAICANLFLFSPREWITSSRIRNLYGWRRKAAIKNKEDIFSFVSYFLSALKTIFWGDYTLFHLPVGAYLYTPSNTLCFTSFLFFVFSFLFSFIFPFLGIFKENLLSSCL